jgi:hypothetical protein
VEPPRAHRLRPVVHTPTTASAHRSRPPVRSDGQDARERVRLLLLLLQARVVSATPLLGRHVLCIWTVGSAEDVFQPSDHGWSLSLS